MDQEKTTQLKLLNQSLQNCTSCNLHKGRTNIVFAEGPVNARLMIIGEGPGFNEDQQGRPFVGVAGKLLDKMIGAMGLKREEVFLSNVVKCRPPENRVPEPDERSICGSNLIKEIVIVKPDLIITVGMTASNEVIRFNDKKPTMAKYHGKVEYCYGIPVIPTYHPAALLRNESLKVPTWEDLQKAIKLLEEIDERKKKAEIKG